MALTFASYAAPTGWTRPVALATVAALTAVNYRGVTRTAQLARAIVTAVFVSLGVFVVACLIGSGPNSAGLSDWSSPHGAYGVLQSAGLLFFAFAGYARVATMGEEVRDPARTIPRAILMALAGAIVVYAVVAVTLLAVLGPDDLARSPAPLAAAVQAGGWDWTEPVVRIGAALASLGALLALIAGIGRTGLAMAREHDLPHWLATIHPRYRVPHRVELMVGVAVALLVILTDLRGAIGFSSFGVLLYYFVANAAALTQPDADRRYPRWLQVLGALGCLVLVATLPGTAVLIGIAVFAVGIAARWLRLRVG